jgi:hypothetical protein
MRDGTRRITHITEVVGMEGDVITTQDLFTFQYQGEAPTEIARRVQFQRHSSLLSAAGRVLRARSRADRGYRMSPWPIRPLWRRRVGFMTGLGFLLVAVLRRLKARRLETEAPNAADTRSLSRTTSQIDRIVQRYLPRLDVLKARLARTGRNIGGRMGKKRVAAFIKLFPEAIDLMVRALRSGLPISDAIINAGQEIGDPVGVELRTIESGMRLGRELDELLWDIAKRIDVPEFRFFIIALSVQRETGGNLAETLSNLSDVLRKRRTMRAKARAMASEARASTAILGSLPVVVSILLLLTSPQYIMILFLDVRGLMMIGVACAMLGTGILIMTKMARFEI